MRHKRPYRSALALQTSYFDPKYLGSKLGILTSVLIAMNYFFKCQKITFNLENNKCICRGNFFCLPRDLIYLLQNYFLSYVYLKDINKALEKTGKIQFVSELAILLNL